MGESFQPDFFEENLANSLFFNPGVARPTENYSHPKDQLSDYNLSSYMRHIVSFKVEDIRVRDGINLETEAWVKVAKIR